MMRKYAAHDAYFMVMIAQKQIASIMERKIEGEDDKVVESGPVEVIASYDNGDLKIWFENFQIKL